MNINLDIQIIKDIPKDKINQYEDRVVYNTAVLTREYTKGMRAYPHLSGELERQEIKEPITGKNAEYSLLAGTEYAKYVWKMKKARWTNTSTIPQWYENVFKQKQKTIIQNAIEKAKGELK